jgi:plastocyanin
MPETLKSSTLLIAALAFLLAASGPVVTLPANGAAPPQVSPAAVYTLSLYGSATGGWGLKPNNLTNPGPSLTMFAGDTVTINLYSIDNASLNHTWYVDLNKNNVNDTSDIDAGVFNTSTSPRTFTFTVPNQPGTYTYYCVFHPSVMKGSVTILPAPTYVLYASASSGWGNTSSTIANPGPTLAAHQGDVLTFELISEDGQTHMLFIDVDHSGPVPDASDPQSSRFGGDLTPVVAWSYTVAAAPGNYTYYCGIHQMAMEGSFHVVATQGPPAGAPPDYLVYVVVIIVIAVVAVAALLVVRRKPRTPPTPPPQ